MPANFIHRGAIPRQLALETLDSVQKVLFPLNDAKSRSLLQSLVSTSFLDPDCLRFNIVSRPFVGGVRLFVDKADSSTIEVEFVNQARPMEKQGDWWRLFYTHQ